MAHFGEARVRPNFECLVWRPTPVRLFHKRPVPVHIGGLAWGRLFVGEDRLRALLVQRS